MSRYYSQFLEAMKTGGYETLERRTDFLTGSEALYRDGELLVSDNGKEIESPDLVESITAEPHLVLFGCGHVGKALYDLAVLQDMRLTVIDSREELLTETRFPKATRITGSYDKILAAEYPSFISPYYCIFTHGHTYDSDCLLYTIRHPHSYIGMIGSKAKIAHCFDNMRSHGITECQLAEVHSPIGLSINAVTPQEIAVSIMAQIISVLRKDKKAVLVDSSLLSLAAEKTGVMVRIVDKSGSAPRSTGSMMFVTQEGISGTVGGGAVENHAIERAKKMLNQENSFLLEHHELQGNQPLGMTCGGNVTLLYKIVN
ncbi:MAG: XdhC family protein [Spirochaetales bacterium]|nr:XdhC family protein [Spirochaetales bacterium]